MSLDNNLNHLVQSGVYYNPNRTQIEQARMRKKLKKEQQKEKQELLNRIDNLEVQVKELNNTLQTFLKTYK